MIFYRIYYFRRIATTILCVLLVGLPMVQSAMAHTLFIQSSRSQVSEGKAFPLFFCYGHYFPVSDGLRGKKLNRIQVFPPGQEPFSIRPRDETGLHSYMVEYDKPGLWMLAAETTPGYYTVYTDKKGREHHAIKPLDEIKDKASEIHLSLYSKQYTKTYVRCGEVSAQVPQRAGLTLELVPVNDPFTLKVGDSLVLDVVHEGKPFNGEGSWDATYNGFSTLAEDMALPKTKVSGSRFSVPVTRQGRWYVRYSVEEPTPDALQGKCRQVKLTATLSFQVDSEKKISQK